MILRPVFSNLDTIFLIVLPVAEGIAIIISSTHIKKVAPEARERRSIGTY